MEQASKGLDDAVARAVRLEQSLADVTRRLGENNQATKTTKIFYDQAAAAAEKLWVNQQKELNKIETIVKRLGLNINNDLIGNVNKFGESIDRAGKKFDTSIVGKFSRIEQEIKKAEQAAKRLEALKTAEQKDPMIGPMQRAKFGISQGTQYPSAGELGQKPLWATPKVEEQQQTLTEKISRFFTQSHKSNPEHNKLINDLGNSARVARGIGGGGVHYGLISGMTGLLRSFLLAPSGIQLISLVAGAAIISAGAAIAVAEPVSRRGKRAREFGQGYGAFEASEYAFSPYMDVGAAAAATRAAVDPTSQQRIAMGMLGLNYQAESQKSNAQQMADQNLAFKRFSETMSKENLEALRHNTPLGTMITDERAWGIYGAPKKDLEERAKQAAEDEKRFSMPPETVKIYTDLNSDLERFGLSLENLVAKNLLPFASAIDNVIKWLIIWNTTPQKTLEVPKESWGEWSNPKNWFKGNEEKTKKMPPMPGFQTGAYSVPETGPAMLHADELVMPAKEASAFRDMLKGGTTEGNKDFGEFNRQLMESSNILVDFNREIIPLKDNMGALNEEVNSGKYLAERFGGGGGAGGGGGGGGGLESGVAPIYSTGGIGGAGVPRTLGEGTIGRGSGISSSGLGIGKGTTEGGGGGESNVIDTKAPEISQLPGDKTWGDYGTRANNPGNLNYAAWEGAASKYSYKDPHTGGMHTMGVFKTMPEGVAAAYKLMVRNQAKYGNTVAGALHGWAENSYIGPLAKAAGVGPNDAFDVSKMDPDKVASLLQKQFGFEGRKGSHTATREQILAGVNLGRGIGDDGKAISTFNAGGGSSGGGGASGSWEPGKPIPGGTGFGSQLGTDVGMKAVDPDEREKINAYMKEAGIPATSEKYAWCAAWVNAQLAHEGVKGTGALSVDSFRNWGKAENPEQAKVGDVMITKGGSHVGRFEGMDPKTGLAKFYAGNESNRDEGPNPYGVGIHHGWGKVGEREVDPNQFIFRGATDEMIAASKRNEMKNQVAGYVPKDKPAKETQNFQQPSRPGNTGKMSSMNDASLFQHMDKGNHLTIFNKSGSDINLQTAMLGTAKGNFA